MGNPTPNTFNETITPKKIAYNVNSVIDNTITPTSQYVSNTEGTIQIPSPMQGMITLYTRDRCNVTKYEYRTNENYYTLVDTTYLIYQANWTYTDSTRETLDTSNLNLRYINIKKIIPFSTNGTITMNGDIEITNTLYDANNNPIGFDGTSAGIENGYDYYIRPYNAWGDDIKSNLQALERATSYEDIINDIEDIQYDPNESTRLDNVKLLYNGTTWKTNTSFPSNVSDEDYYIITDTSDTTWAGIQNNLLSVIDPYVIINEEKLYFQDMTNENYWDSLARTSGGNITYNYDLLSQGNIKLYQDYHIIVDTHGQTGTEVIDIPGLMWQILIMPFSFISQAFNVTIFEGTPYQLNFANLFKGLIAIMTLLFVIRLFTGGINMLGEYSTQIEGASAKREQRKRDRKLYRDSKNGVVEKDVE